jgi:RNA polymerase-binding protein DksA
MDKKFIEERKKDLLLRKENIKKQLSSFAKQSTSKKDDYQTEWTEFGDKDDDNVSEVENFERNLTLEDTLELSLNKINKALEKIKDGTYGRCEKCNGPIAEGRLKVFPSASACMKCKKANL